MIVSAIFGVIGSIISAVGAMKQAEANAQAAEFNAKVAERNKQIVLEQTALEVAEKKTEHRRQLASIRAEYGASGVDIAGSPLEVLEDTAFEQAIERDKISYSGKLKAIGYDDESTLQTMTAENERQAGAIGAASAIFGGISQIGSSLAAA